MENETISRSRRRKKNYISTPENPLRSHHRAAFLSFYHFSFLPLLFLLPLSRVVFYSSFRIPLSLYTCLSKVKLSRPPLLFERQVTTIKMRSDSGEILAKIPPFILISFLSSVSRRSSPTSFGNPYLYESRDSASRGFSPEDYSLGLLSSHCRTLLRVTPVGLSSPFTIPKRSIYNVVTLRGSTATFFSLSSLLSRVRTKDGFLRRLRFPLTVTFADCVGDGANWPLRPDDRASKQFSDKVESL